MKRVLIVAFCFTSVNASPSSPIWCDYSAISNDTSCMRILNSEQMYYSDTNLSYGGVLGTHNVRLDELHPAMGAFSSFAWPKVEQDIEHSLSLLVENVSMAVAKPIARRTCNMSLLELRVTHDGISPIESTYRGRDGKPQVYPVFAGVTAFAQLRTAWALSRAGNTTGVGSEDVRVVIIEHRVAVTYDVSRSMAVTQHEWIPSMVGVVTVPRSGIEHSAGPQPTGSSSGEQSEQHASVSTSELLRSRVGDSWLPATCPKRDADRTARIRLSSVMSLLTREISMLTEDERIQRKHSTSPSTPERAFDFLFGRVEIDSFESTHLCSAQAEPGSDDNAENDRSARGDLATEDPDLNQVLTQTNKTDCLHLRFQPVADAKFTVATIPAKLSESFASAEVQAVGDTALSFSHVDAVSDVSDSESNVPSGIPPPPGAEEGYPFPAIPRIPPTHPGRRGEVLRGPSMPIPLRIACYNAWNSNPPSWLIPNPRARFERYGDRLDLLAAELSPYSPDVVLVQEVRLDSTLGGPNDHAQMPHLAMRFPGYQYVSQPAMLHHGMGAGNGGMGLARRDEEGVAVMSRHPILLSDYVLLSRDVDDPEDGHQRVALHAVIEVANQSSDGPSLIVDVYTVHMPLGVRARRRLARELHHFVRVSRRGHVVVVAGDMNAEPDEPCVQFWQGIAPPPMVPPLVSARDEAKETQSDDEGGDGDADEDRVAANAAASTENHASTISTNEAENDLLGATLGHSHDSRSGFYDAWMVAASSDAPSESSHQVQWQPHGSHDLSIEDSDAERYPPVSVTVSPREVVLGWSDDRVRREALTFPSDNATKRIDFVYVAYPPPVPQGSTGRGFEWMAQGESCRTEGECFTRPQMVLAQTVAAWLVGQDAKPGVGNLSAVGLGMVSPESPLWASDHRGMLVDLAVHLR